MNFFKPNDLEPLISAERIHLRVTELAALIDADYSGRRPLLLGVLTGSFIFLADLCRHMRIECEIDFIRVESYGDNTTTCGSPDISMGTKLAVAGRPVILVDEIVDTGLTLEALLKKLEEMGALEVRVCALIDKKAHRRVQVKVDYAGFELEDGFLVGYGLDAAELKRNLPDIRLLEE